MREKEENITIIRELAAEGILSRAILGRAENVFARQAKEDRPDSREFEVELTLRAMSFYIGRVLPARKPDVSDLFSDCLPPYTDLKSITNGKSHEEIFVAAVVPTLEKFWAVAEEKFAGSSEKKLQRVVDLQWWEVRSRQDGFSSKEWQIAVRCAQAQQDKDSLGTVIKTICECFSVPPPTEYQDAPAKSFSHLEQPGQRTGRHQNKWLA